MRLTGINEIFQYNNNMSARRPIPQLDPLSVQVRGVEDVQKQKDSLSTSDKKGINESDAKNQTPDREVLDTKEVINYAVNAQMNKDKELIGSESDLQRLDVEKAVSDMRKDSILQEYQFFVGNNVTPDGSFARK